MAAPGPATSAFPRLSEGYEVPENFRGCKCLSSKCETKYCPCQKEGFRCTLKCLCSECDNPWGAKGSDSNTGPGQGGTSSMAAPRPTAPALRKLVGVAVPEDFKGCKCENSRCKTGLCRCFKGRHPCTSKCQCKSCDNRFIVGGSGSSTEPGQGGTGGVSNVPDETTPPPNNEHPSSGIEREQAGTSSIATQMAAPSPTGFLLLVGNDAPEEFKGCRCLVTLDLFSSGMQEVVRQCDNENCPCWTGRHLCTSKCKCQSCANRFRAGGSGSSTEPGQGGTSGVSNVPDETTPPPNTEPEQADDTSGMAREAPQMEEQSRGNRNFDLNELPSSSDEAST